MESPVPTEKPCNANCTETSPIDPVDGAMAFFADLIGTVANRSGIILTNEQKTTAIAWSMNEFTRNFTDSSELRVSLDTALMVATTTEGEAQYFVH